jgi:surfeit locus 1 family protein
MKRHTLLALSILATLGFCALGIWQLERRVWKLALIERVEARVHAVPIAPPPPREWPTLTREKAEYLRVSATGRFLPGHETLVRAITARGSGFWVMAPFRTDAGFTLLVNRGFIPPSSQAPAARADAGTRGEPLTMTGLVRMTEPGGAFLRANAPDQNRWYSRDVAALSQAQHLGSVAPYFIDAEAGYNGSTGNDTGPIGGLTVIAFRNSHLMYVFTWLSLALLTAAFGVRVARHP